MVEEIEEMGMTVSIPMKRYCLATWKLLTPISLFFILIMSFIHYSPAYFSSFTQEDYLIPCSIQFLRWLMPLVPTALIEIGVPVKYSKQKQCQEDAWSLRKSEEVQAQR